MGRAGGGARVKLVHTFTGHQAPLTTLLFTESTTSLLASGCQGGEVRVWDLQVRREEEWEGEGEGEEEEGGEEGKGGEEEERGESYMYITV